MSTDLAPMKRISSQRMEYCVAFVGEGRLNPRKSAEIAKYKGDCANVGKKLLRLPEIQQCIRDLFGQLDFDRENAPVMLADELLTMAMFNPQDIFEQSDSGEYFTIRSIADMPRSTAICIKSITAAKIMVDGERIMASKLEFYDKYKAAEILGRWLGMEKRDGGVLEDLEPTPVWQGMTVIGLPQEHKEDVKDFIQGLRPVSAITSSSDVIEQSRSDPKDAQDDAGGRAGEAGPNGRDAE